MVNNLLLWMKYEISVYSDIQEILKNKIFNINQEYCVRYLLMKINGYKTLYLISTYINCEKSSWKNTGLAVPK